MKNPLGTYVTELFIYSPSFARAAKNLRKAQKTCYTNTGHLKCVHCSNMWLAELYNFSSKVHAFG